MRKLELLSPAGDMERLRMSVLYGADAVYLAAKNFGARASAENFTMEQLAEVFPSAVIDVLQLLTHREDVPYYDYVRAIKANPIAVKIKLADLAHNSDQTRCRNLTQQQLAYFREKYARAVSILTEE